MSNYFAIATVTEALHQLLLKKSPGDTTSVDVSVEPPDLAIKYDHPNPTLNIFLYQVTLNMGYRNSDLPARNIEGVLVKRPLLGLDLHYMITALGPNDLQAQMALAIAMRILHETPVLTRDFISQTIQNTEILKDSDLADQIERVKITHQNLSLEEMTKLWSSFFQTNYRISTTYQATVVLLESKKQTKPTLPVLTPQLKMIAFNQPLIQQVQPQILEYNPNANTILTLTGLNFQADDVTVQIGDQKTVTPSSNSDTKITITIPNDITPGVKAVQIIQSLKLGVGSNLTSHKIFKSNVVAFVLAPIITKINGNIINGPNPIAVSKSADLVLTFAPSVAQSQKVSFLVGDYELLLPQRNSQIPVNELSALLSSNPLLLQSITDDPTKTYLLRIRVDGAESLLTVDKDQTSTTYSQFIFPAITVT
jgi:hypothetical protein